MMLEAALTELTKEQDSIQEPLLMLQTNTVTGKREPGLVDEEIVWCFGYRNGWESAYAYLPMFLLS